MANRFYIDIKEDHNGNLTGSIKFPQDSLFTLEVLCEVIQKLSEACGVAPTSITHDLGLMLKQGMN